MDEDTPRSSRPPERPPQGFPPPPEPGIPQWNQPASGYGPRPQGTYPMDIGRVFSLTFSIFRYRWLKFVGVAVLVTAPAWLLLALATALTIDASRWFYDLADLARGATVDIDWTPIALLVAVNLIVGVVAGLFVYVAYAAVTDMAATVYGGGQPNATGSVRVAIRRLGTLVGAALVVFMATMLVLAAGVFIGVALFALTSVDGRVVGGPPVFLGLVVFVATMAGFVFLTIRWTLLIPVVMLERVGAMEALRRSWHLVSGSSWRVLGYQLAFALLLGLIGIIPSVVITFLFSPPQVTAGLLVSYDPVRLAISGFLNGLISSALSPILWIGMTLLYFDLRWRKGETVPQAGQSVPAVPPASPAP